MTLGYIEWQAVAVAGVLVLGSLGGLGWLIEKFRNLVMASRDADDTEAYLADFMSDLMDGWNAADEYEQAYDSEPLDIRAVSGGDVEAIIAKFDDDMRRLARYPEPLIGRPPPALPGNDAAWYTELCRELETKETT